MAGNPKYIDFIEPAIVPSMYCLQSKEKIAIRSTKIVENQIENEGDLHLAQQRALSKHFLKTDSTNPPISEFQN